MCSDTFIFSNKLEIKNMVENFGKFYSQLILHHSLFVMPPTSKKLRGHIGLGLSVRLSVRPSVRLSVRPSVRLSVCLSVTLFGS